MTDIYKEENEELELSKNSKPIHGSIILLAIRIILATLIFDMAFSLIFYSIGLIFNIPVEFQFQASIGLFITLIVKNILLVFFIVYIVLRWATTVYYISGHHLVIKTGILHTKEDVYEFKTIRSLEVDQSLLGRIFHYGNIILKTSASGGFQVVVTLLGLSNPQKQERLLNVYF